MSDDERTQDYLDDVLGVFETSDLGETHDHCTVDYEHECVFVTCIACGAQWSVHETWSEVTFGFEEISRGDESCYEKVPSDV